MPNSINRRAALARISLGLAGFWSAVFGGLAAAFALNPLRHMNAPQKVNLGALTKFTDTFQLVVHEREVRDGWKSSVELVKLFVRLDADGNPEVFSAICTHLGCSVYWKNDTSEFRCPCHGGRYAEDGTVVSGPPPAPLPRLTVITDENNDLVVELS